jgi:hypothetical protein
MSYVMMGRFWTELDYGRDIFRVTKEAHLHQLQKLEDELCNLSHVSNFCFEQIRGVNCCICAFVRVVYNYLVPCRAYKWLCSLLFSITFSSFLVLRLENRTAFSSVRKRFIRKISKLRTGISNYFSRVQMSSEGNISPVLDTGHLL